MCSPVNLLKKKTAFVFFYLLWTSNVSRQAKTQHRRSHTSISTVGNSSNFVSITSKLVRSAIKTSNSLCSISVGVLSTMPGRLYLCISNDAVMAFRLFSYHLHSNLSISFYNLHAITL